MDEQLWEKHLEQTLNDLENEIINPPLPYKLPIPYRLINCNYYSPQNTLVKNPCNSCLQCKLKDLKIIMFISNNEDSHDTLRELIVKKALIGISDITFAKFYTGVDQMEHKVVDYPFFYSLKTRKNISGFKKPQDLIDLLS